MAPAAAVLIKAAGACGHRRAAGGGEAREADPPHCADLTRGCENKTRWGRAPPTRLTALKNAAPPTSNLRGAKHLSSSSLLIDAIG